MAEMVRSYNQVSTSLSRSHWRRKLTPLQKALWDDLISWPTYCGLFHIDVEERAWYHGVTVEEINAALERFAAEGKVKVSGTFIWVLEFVDHQSFNPNMRKAAASELHSLEARTSLASEALAKLNGTLQEGSPILDETIQDETILDVSSASTASQPPRKPKGKPRQREPEPEQYRALAADVIWYIKERIQKYNIAHGALDNDPETCATQLRLLVESDGYPLDCILPALAWAWTREFKGTSGAMLRYGAQLLSIRRWRVDNKFGKLWKQWHENTPGRCAASIETNSKLRDAIHKARERGNA